MRLPAHRSPRPGELQLDHLGVIVNDLTRGSACWERLGFQLSRTSPQMGLTPSANPQVAAKFEPWATANRCAIFEEGYLELIGVHRPECFNPWQSRLDRFEGAHILAVRCANADSTYEALRAISEDFDPPVQRRRDAPYGQSTREMAFRNIFSQDAKVPECRYIVIEHQTPDVLWQADLVTHPNTAVRLTAAYMQANHPSVQTRMDALAAIGSAEQHDGSTHFHAGGRVQIANHTALSARFPGTPPLPDPAVLGCQVEVRDMQQTCRVLETNNVPFATAGSRLWVAPDSANGCLIEFTEKE